MKRKEKEQCQPKVTGESSTFPNTERTPKVQEVKLNSELIWFPS